MLQKSLLHQLHLGFWALRPDAVGAYMPQVEAILFGRSQEQLEVVADASAPQTVGSIRFITAENDQLPLRSDAPIPPTKGLVAVVNIDGPIMKNDFCGDIGMTTLAQWYKAFEETPEVLGIVEMMDSPGGLTSAMDVLAAQKQRMSKPIVTLVHHGQACSAAYGIAACSDLVFASSEGDQFGSIGTYVEIKDYKGMEESRGIKTHTIVATRSKNKLAAYQEALKADNTNPDDPHYAALRQQRVDPVNELFIGMVQKARPGIQDTAGVFEGSIFLSRKAMELGLVDSVNETLDSAIAAVRELATKQHNTN